MKDQIPVLERLRAELVAAVRRRGGPVAERSIVRRRRFAVAAAAVTAVAVIAVASIALTRNGNIVPDVRPRPSDPRALGAPESPIGGGMASCVEQFSVENLRKRAFAFDGVIRSISVPERESDQPTLVTFEVTHWYKGGSGDGAELKTYERPGAITSASLGQHDPVQLQEGQRVLGSGEDDFLWSCGFSMLYTQNNAELFRAAFE
jgi:hypothetical protein